MFETQIGKCNEIVEECRKQGLMKLLPGKHRSIVEAQQFLAKLKNF